MSNVQTKPARGYDQLAPFYQSMERLRFGSSLQRARTSLLDQIPDCENALFLGDGDGRLLTEFSRRRPQCRVTSLDISERMLRLQQRRLKRRNDKSNVQFVHADVRDWTAPPETFDLIVTAFHLDCFKASEVAELTARLTPSLRERGCWYVVDFAIPDGGWKRHWARVWSTAMILFFRIQTGLQGKEIIDFRRMFGHLGWSALAEFESPNGFQFATIFQLKNTKAL